MYINIHIRRSPVPAVGRMRQNRRSAWQRFKSFFCMDYQAWWDQPLEDFLGNRPAALN